MSKNVKGVLGEKLGMTQVWDENNKIVPVTVVKAGPCVVTQVRSADNDGYSAVQLGFGIVIAGEDDLGAQRFGQWFHCERDGFQHGIQPPVSLEVWPAWQRSA